jgi:PadR family transcriptional regulator, regulatory protein PadR
MDHYNPLARWRPSRIRGTALVRRYLSNAQLAAARSRRVEQITGGTFVVQPGSLFPALHRLEEAGWLTSTWQPSENNRRAKYYTLTRTGRRQLEKETAQWNRIALGMARALDA